ncbi:MAG: pyrroline-5-carboxylate reductase family protein [Solirubrobacterales bacterium]
MQIGLIGSGNIATAFALGWGQPVLCTDIDSSRAEALATATGGEAVGGNAELAARSDLVILCHKPAQLGEVAAEAAGGADVILSPLAGVPLAELRAAYPGSLVFRVMPNIAMRLGHGVTVLADDDGGDPVAFETIRSLLEELGPVFVLPEAEFAAATAVMSSGVAFLALVAEAKIEAAVESGMDPVVAASLVGATFGSAMALLSEDGADAAIVREAVTSPGGVTEKGLAELEQAKVREAFAGAVRAVIEGGA